MEETRWLRLQALQRKGVFLGFPAAGGGVLWCCVRGPNLSSLCVYVCSLMSVAGPRVESSQKLRERERICFEGILTPLAYFHSVIAFVSLLVSIGYPFLISFP